MNDQILDIRASPSNRGNEIAIDYQRVHQLDKPTNKCLATPSLNMVVYEYQVVFLFSDTTKVSYLQSILILMSKIALHQKKTKKDSMKVKLIILFW